MRKVYVLFFFVFSSFNCFADPLGTLPVIEKSNLLFLFENSSDLWTSPYSDKTSPIRIYNAKMRAPVVASQGWTGSLNLEGEGLSLGRTDLVLEPNRVNLGSDFRSQSVGFGVTRDHEDKSSFTFYVSHMSDSDEPFKNARDRWFEGMLLYRSPLKGTSHWVVMLNHTRNRGFHNGRIFPYVGWMYEPTDEMNLLIGFPFFRLILSQPSEWTKTLLVTPVEARAEIERDLDDRFRVHVLAAFASRSYLHANRVQDEDRLFYEEKSVEIGFKTRLTDTTGLKFSLGYSFDRRLYEAPSIDEPNGTPVNFNSDVYGRLGLEFRL